MPRSSRQAHPPTKHQTAPRAHSAYLRLIPAHDDRLRSRLRAVGGLILLGFCLLLLRAWHLQVVQGPNFLHLSEQNRLRHHQVKSLRGKIVDRDGHIIATNRPAYTLMAIPTDLPSPDAVLESLRQLEITLEDVKHQIIRLRASPKPIILQEDMPRDRMAYFIEHQMEFPGFFLEVTPLRSYPHGKLAAHLLGYMGQITEAQRQRQPDRPYAIDTLVGHDGSEHQYEDLLRGTAGIRQVEVDTFGRETQQLGIQPPTPGVNLVLTLDVTLQQLAEQLLESHTGSIVALDPRNGQLLASASNPTFDPSLFATRLSPTTWTELKTHPKKPLHNRVIQGQYPPGSIFKIITALAALEEGLTTPETQICCKGHYTYGRRTYRDWKHSGHGCVDLYQALAQSCDVYFYKMGEVIGVDRLATYARDFGLGQITGIGIGTEQPGLIPSKQWKRQARGAPWYGGETLSVAIGQGYTLTTPLQVANLIATLANGGTLYRPYVMLAQQQTAGAEFQHLPPTTIRHLTVQPHHLDLIKHGLWGVVNDPKGTGRQAQHDRIQIAGKTATVQVVSLPDGEHGPAGQALWPEHQRDHAWFAAYAPVEEPRIVVVVMIEHAGKGGSHFAALSKQLIQTYLEHNLVSAHTPPHHPESIN